MKTVYKGKTGPPGFYRIRMDYFKSTVLDTYRELVATVNDDFSIWINELPGSQECRVSTTGPWHLWGESAIRTFTFVRVTPTPKELAEVIDSFSPYALEGGSENYGF